MKKALVKTLFIILLTQTKIWAQTPIVTEPTPFLDKHKYLKSIVLPDSLPQTTLIGFGIQYLFIPESKSFRTNGTHANISVNIARLFSPKFHFGICFDYKPIPSLNKSTFSQDFITDFNYYFIDNYTSPNDSAKAYIVKDAINNGQANHFKGNTFGTIGISLSPFPKKYGGFLIQIKKGVRYFLIDGVRGNDLLSNNDLNYISFDLKNNYSLELSFRPWMFKDNTRNNLNLIKQFYKFISITLYYERLDLRNSSFDGMHLEQMVKSDFMKKYKYSDNFGFKIGYMIY